MKFLKLSGLLAFTSWVQWTFVFLKTQARLVISSWVASLNRIFHVTMKSFVKSHLKWSKGFFILYSDQRVSFRSPCVRYLFCLWKCWAQQVIYSTSFAPAAGWTHRLPQGQWRSLHGPFDQCEHKEKWWVEVLTMIEMYWISLFHLPPFWSTGVMMFYVHSVVVTIVSHNLCFYE